MLWLHLPARNMYCVLHGFCPWTPHVKESKSPSSIHNIIFIQFMDFVCTMGYCVSKIGMPRRIIWSQLVPRFPSKHRCPGATENPIQILKNQAIFCSAYHFFLISISHKDQHVRIYSWIRKFVYSMSEKFHRYLQVVQLVRPISSQHRRHQQC